MSVMEENHSDAKRLGLSPESLRRLLPDMTDDELDKLIAVLPMEQIHVVSPPVTGLIMAKVRDCFDTDFFLGEVLVTRTEVRYGEYRARATIMGSRPKSSLVAAALDVLAMSGQSTVLERAVSACQPATARIRQREQLEARLTAATRVHFETMSEEP